MQLQLSSSEFALESAFMQLLAIEVPRSYALSLSLSLSANLCIDGSLVFCIRHNPVPQAGYLDLALEPRRCPLYIRTHISLSRAVMNMELRDDDHDGDHGDGDVDWNGESDEGT